MKYLVLLLAASLAAGNGQTWPLGERYTREIVLQIPRPHEFPFPPSQVFLDHAPWDDVKLPPGPPEIDSAYHESLEPQD